MAILSNVCSKAAPFC